MLRLTPVLGVLALAGILAGGSFGSAGASGHALRVAGVRASFHTADCKPKQKTRCVKPKPETPRTVTVTRHVVSTVTRTETNVQTATTTQTVTVTAPAPAAQPASGTYSGYTQNFGTVSFVVGGTPGALQVQQVGIDEVDATCTYSVDGSVAHLTIYDVSFPDPSPLDAAGRFSASGTAKWDNGDSLTVTFAGTVGTNYTASGTVSSLGKFSDSDGVWTCTNSAVWKALLG
jgi:hypothetical protein